MRFAAAVLSRRLLPIAVFWLAAGAGAAGARTTQDGVYTESQAAEGRRVHARHCARCHEPGYYQGSFLSAWQSVPLATLYDVIELKMPEDAPGSLRPDEYAAVLAWVLALNGLPAGERKLPHDREALARIRIDLGE
ncbi:MAG TPA: c-type cytochrome [Pseudomonadales bacterium]